jgi:thioredoxin-related protein
MLKIPFKLLLIFLLHTLLYGGIYATGIDFFKGSWLEAQNIAQKQHKGIFLTAHSPNCPTCKDIELQIEQEKTLTDYYNQHFVSYKIDLESSDGAMLAAQYGIAQLPNCLFLDADGNIIQRSEGKLDKWDLLELGMAATENLPNRAGASKITDNSSQKNTTLSKENSAIVLDKNNIYAYLAQAIANKDAALLNKLETVIGNLPDAEKEKQQLLIAYYKGIGDNSALNNMERQQKMRDAQMKDPIFWHRKATNLVQKTAEKRHLKQALQWIEFSLSLEEKYDSQETHAFILYKLGKRKEAITAAETALKLAHIADKPCNGAYNLLQMLKRH